MIAEAMKTYERNLAIGAAVSGVFVMAVLFGFGYHAGLFVSNTGASNIVYESPLLPRGWVTYRSEEWSVGYPSTYLPQERPERNTVYFIPEDFDENVTYFLVQWETRSLRAEKIRRTAAGYAAPVDVMIANYPALKYTLSNGRVEFVIEHDTEIYALIMDDPDAPDIAPMLATFTFTE